MEITIWAGFIAFILMMLAIDLFVLNRTPHLISSKQALGWSGICVVLAMVFNLFVYFLYDGHWGEFGISRNLTGTEAALEFFTAWIVEQSLSLDNVFVIALIFSYFKIPREYQHRVLFWGVLGALIMRAIMIALGAALISSFSWVHYFFGGLLIYAAIKLLTVNEESLDPQHNLFYKIATKLYPLSKTLDGEKFFTTIDGKRAITPLFVVLLVIESTDLVFAVDSIPAVFAITEDPFLVFTSNIFAILNLRSLYFALSALMDKFSKLKLGLIFVLLFVGAKMIFSHVFKIPTVVTFIVIVGVLSLSIGYSLIHAKQNGNSKK